MNLPAQLTAVSLLALALAACGKSDAPREEASKGSQPQAGATPSKGEPTAAAPAASAPTANPRAALQSTTLTTEDIDRWQRGLAAEKKAVQDAAEKLAAAKDDTAKLTAVHAAMEMTTAEAGAKAAGVDLDTYRRIGRTLSSAVAQLSPLEMEMKVSEMPPAAVEQMKQAREAGAARLAAQLPPDVMAALKTRAADLRRQDIELVGERMKVATAR